MEFKMHNKLPSHHANIATRYPSALPMDLEGITTPTEHIPMTVHLAENYLRQEALKFQSCPECESKNLEYYGYSSNKGTQRYRCKSCGRQFVSQRDSVLVKSKRRQIYTKAFIKAQDTHGFWDAALIETLAYLEGHQGRLMINKTLQNSFESISSKKGLEALVFTVVREAYNRIMATH
jgi:transposase-like protein